MYNPEDARYLDAILCTLLVQAQRPIRLTAADVVTCGERYRLGVQVDWDAAAVTLTVVDPNPPRRSGARRLPSRRKMPPKRR